MEPTHAIRPTLIRNRRIGRKALQADRLHKALAPPVSKKHKRSWQMPSVRPKVLIAAFIALACIGTLGLIGLQRYNSQANVAQKAAATKQLIELKARSSAADACRREKAAQKADLIGKITYDELYDYGECDK